MSTSIPRKTWSQLWDPASSILNSKLSLRPPQHLTRHASSTPLRRGFTRNLPTHSAVSSAGRPPAKRLLPCGVFLADRSPKTTRASAIASCPTTVGKAVYTPLSTPRRLTATSLQQTWRRGLHTSSNLGAKGTARRNKNYTPNPQNSRPQDLGRQKPPRRQHVPEEDGRASVPPKESPAVSDNHIHLPKMPHYHRPTKEELLAAATGFWSRLKVRFKWVTIRSVRPWNVDDWSAFVSWFVLGNIVWILVGTTTFFSLIIFSINTVVAQGMLVPVIIWAHELTTTQKRWHDGLATTSPILQG